jgi:hypothetical protein
MRAPRIQFTKYIDNKGQNDNTDNRSYIYIYYPRNTTTNIPTI